MPRISRYHRGDIVAQAGKCSLCEKREQLCVLYNADTDTNHVVCRTHMYKLKASRRRVLKPVAGAEKVAYYRRYSNSRYEAWKVRLQHWKTEHGNCCCQCGSSEYLEIDHNKPETKLHQIYSMHCRTLAVREAELSKCQLLCSACHRKKTADEQRTGSYVEQGD